MHEAIASADIRNRLNDRRRYLNGRQVATTRKTPKTHLHRPTPQ